MKNILKDVREKRGMSQEELSEKSKVSRTTISEIENNETAVVKNTTLEKLARALDKKVSDIFFIEEAQHVEQK